ncbi:hypothetical protein [Micromonospora echinofusca]|uniref:hypothetical protein n=1 Tax=Micromonospora echinofusca TaxID=47858 RepID=UPI0033E65B68
MTLPETLPALPDIDEVPTVDAEDEKVLQEVRAVLDRHGALGRFGVWLLHQHFDLADDEMMLETVDKENRVLTTRPVKMSEISDGTSVETTWRLDSPTGQRRCETMCAKPYGPNGPHMRQHFTTG